jgi:uncharacterized membrane protein
MFVSLLPFSTSLLNAFPQAFIAPLFFGANLAVIGWIPFFQWTYVNSQPDMLADFVSAEYRKTVSARMLIVPVATTLTACSAFGAWDQTGDLPLAPASIHAPWKVRGR